MGIALPYVVQLLDAEFPPETALDGDVTGLQLQAGRAEVSSVLVCLDVTDEVVTEAQQGAHDMVVSFHPLIFHPLRALTEAERVGHLSTRLIQSGIALFALHTRVDAHPQGTNARFAQALGLRVREPLVPNRLYPGYGVGVIAEAEPPLEAEELLERIAARVGQPLRYVPGKRQRVRTVAIVGGSGSSLLPEAHARDVDAFVTGEVKYHTFHHARGQLWLIEAGHAETEQFVPQAIAERLSERLPIPVEIARTWCNPIRWYPFRISPTSLSEPR